MLLVGLRVHLLADCWDDQMICRTFIIDSKRLLILRCSMICVWFKFAITAVKLVKQLVCTVARDSSFAPCCRANSLSLSIMARMICLVEFSIWDILESRLLLAVMVEALWASSFWWSRSRAVVIFVAMASILESSFD